jgi:50S ribosomal protein L16 3-hydroxylase
MTAPVELNLDRETFLARHWQRKPLVIRNALARFKPPISAHQLAGLALEPHVESRIVEQCDDQWRVHHGPFANADYHRDHPWTLLVQAVDHHLPEVAELRRLVDFLPQWRVDDVMVSYAVDGGSAGPHYDNYDVFLLQGEGRRLWRLGQYCDDSTPLLPDETLCMVGLFECQEEVLLESGDMLYIPPRIAHWGIARGDCTTFSIGFRAPRLSDLVSRWVDRLLETMDPELFYTDPGTESATRPGEIRPRDLERVMAQLQGALDQEFDNHWFGELVTEPRYEPPVDDDDLAEARALLEEGTAWVGLSTSAKVAWQQEASGIVVFANGESRAFPPSVLPFVTDLCGSWRVEGEALAAALADSATDELLNYLLDNGCIYVE